jgi:hypothetical protein
MHPKSLQWWHKKQQKKLALCRILCDHHSLQDLPQFSVTLALEEPDSESITTRRTPSVRPRNTFTDDPDSDLEYAGEETEGDEDEWSDDTAGIFDFVTERNTEQNALIATHEMTIGEMDPDDTGMDPDPFSDACSTEVRIAVKDVRC